MIHDRFDEHEARRRALEEGALGWCQFEGDKPEDGYFLLGRLSDGSTRAMDRRGWESLRLLGSLLREGLDR